MKQKAFTLIELLVVIGIIGILSAIGVVSFGAVREKARRGACIATLRSNFNSDENLVAYWNFDEGAGSPTAKDFWGNNGTLGADSAIGTDDPTYQNGGIIDSVLSFDGGDYVTIPDNLNLDGMVAITISVWAKGNTTLGNTIISKYNFQVGTPLSYFLWYDSPAGNLVFITKNSSDSKVTHNTNYAGDSNWHHYGAVYDGATMRVYVDGILVGGSTAQTGVISNNAQSVKIGAYSRTGPPPIGGTWNGLIDEPIIYNRALSADEIASHYKACKK